MKRRIFIYFSLFQLWFLILIPIVLFILPADYFDKGQTVCLSVTLFKTECYACGITRAIMHLIHFNIREAAFYNLLSFIVLPLLAYIWFNIVYNYYRAIKKEKKLMPINFLTQKNNVNHTYNFYLFVKKIFISKKK